MTQAPLLSTVNITRSYGAADAATLALRGVTIDIDEREFVAIMGSSGSGKSTLLHILGLLDRPTSGSYFLRGQDMATASDGELAHLRNETMGFVFQSFHLLARATVLDNVLLPLHYSSRPINEHNELATRALAQVDMSHRLQHRPEELSGGEKQRVAIARALVNEPQLIFADEPTGNLDSANGTIVMQLIEKLHKAGHTIVMITHDQNAAGYAQRIIHFVDGTVAETPVQLVHHHD